MFGSLFDFCLNLQVQAGGLDAGLNKPGKAMNWEVIKLLIE